MLAISLNALSCSFNCISLLMGLPALALREELSFCILHLCHSSCFALVVGIALLPQTLQTIWVHHVLQHLLSVAFKPSGILAMQRGLNSDPILMKHLHMSAEGFLECGACVAAGHILSHTPCTCQKFSFLVLADVTTP